MAEQAFNPPTAPPGEMVHHRRIWARPPTLGRRSPAGRAVGAGFAPRAGAAGRRHGDHDQRGFTGGSAWSRPNLRSTSASSSRHRIGILDQRLGERHAVGRREVERDGPLAPVHDVEARRLFIEALRHRLDAIVDAAPPVGIAAGLDLDHVGAEVGQVARADRPGPAHRQVDYAQPFERLVPSRRGCRKEGATFAFLGTVCCARPAGTVPPKLAGVRAR